MANHTKPFNKNFGDIEVTIQQDGQTSVRGPQKFVEGIDWDGVQDTARLFACHTDPYMAIALAIQMKYAAWHGTKVTLAALS